MKTICVFCSASDVDQIYKDAAIEIGTKMVSHGYNLVWGGSDTGIMKVVADAVDKAGGDLIGISVEFLHDKARKETSEMVITRDLSERKKLLLARGDAFVLLVGGVGSLDEIAEIVELKKHRHHNKPVVILNTNNFYEGLNIQLNRMNREGFISRPIDDLVYFAPTPDDALNYIDEKMKESPKVA